MRPILLLIMATLCPLATAEQAWFYNIQVREAIVDTDRFGHCMIRLKNSVDIQAKLPSCKASYVTMDCGGELPGASKSTNAKKFDIAQISVVARRPVALLVTDEQTVDGFCSVRQARLL